MKLKVIIPIANFPEEIIQLKKAYLATYLPSEVALDVEALHEGPSALMGEIDSAHAVPFVARHVVKAEKEGFEGVLIDCFDDPGTRVYRELVDIPVIGAFEGTMNACSQLMDTVSILAPEIGAVPSTRHKVMTSPYKDIVQDIIGIELQEGQEEITAISNALRKMDGQVDAIVLGCTAFSCYIESLKQLNLFSKIIEPSSLSALDLYRLVKSACSNGRKTYPKRYLLP